MTEYARSTELGDELFDRVWSAVRAGDEITTLSSKRPNRIVSIDRSGVSVETLRSDRRGTALTQQLLLNALNVKRSAFVCVLPARRRRPFDSPADSLKG